MNGGIGDGGEGKSRGEVGVRRQVGEGEGAEALLLLLLPPSLRVVSFRSCPPCLWLGCGLEPAFLEGWWTASARENWRRRVWLALLTRACLHNRHCLALSWLAFPGFGAWRFGDGGGVLAWLLLIWVAPVGLFYFSFLVLFFLLSCVMGWGWGWGHIIVILCCWLLVWLRCLPPLS